jgi:hypothetical protein
VHFSQVILEMRGLSNHLPGLAWTMFLPISTSQVAKITSMSHRLRLKTFKMKASYIQESTLSY